MKQIRHSGLARARHSRGVKFRGALSGVADFDVVEIAAGLPKTEHSWSNAAPIWTLHSLRQANLDVKDKLITPGFRSGQKNLSYACKVELKDVANNLIFSRVLLPKPRRFVELQEFMDSCWRQLPGWQGLGQRPVLTAANIKLAKLMRCKGFLIEVNQVYKG
eukprot:g14444.t1